MKHQLKQMSKNLPTSPDCLHIRGTRMRGRDVAFNQHLLSVLHWLTEELKQIRAELTSIKAELDLHYKHPPKNRRQ